MKCAINISNHAKGAGDIYTISLHTDVNENNAYWNHPTEDFKPPLCTFHDVQMYSSDPRKVKIHPFRLNLITRLPSNDVKDKPFIVTEWNDIYPTKFRSEAMLMMATYGGLQDWGGMLLYSYTHSDTINEMKGDMVKGFFNVYNNPATWGQVGLCATIFYGEMIKLALNSIDLCYTPNDMKMVPENWMAPFGIVPFISKIRTCFIENKYQGDAEVVLSSGFSPTGDFSESKQAFVFTRSPYIDLYQKVRGKVEFLGIHMDGEEIQDLNGAGKIGKRYAVITEEAIIDEDYKAYGDLVDTAMKKWKILDNNKGLQKTGTIISDTGELSFNFTEGKFTIDADKVVSYSGNVNGSIDMGRFQFDIVNHKMTITILPLDKKI